LAYPFAVVTGMNRDVSDHVPLLLLHHVIAIHLDLKISRRRDIDFWILCLKVGTRKLLICMIIISDMKR
jgi:hypothetical protein